MAEVAHDAHRAGFQHRTLPWRPSSRVAALDGLRGIYTLLVLFHYMLLMLPDFANVEWQVPGAARHGAVEWLLLRTPLRLMWAGQKRALLFFVLSGFVLSIPWLDNRPESYGRFLLNRFCRIYPPYIIAMVLAASGSIWLGGHKLASASIYFNTLGWVFQPSWAAVRSIAAMLNAPSSQYMNEAVWSLVWEVRVTLIFPLLFLRIVPWRIRGVMAVLGATVLLRHLACLLIGPRLSIVLNVPQDTFYYAEYFVFGAAVALNWAAIAARFSRHRSNVGLACLSIGLLVCWFSWPAQHDRIVGLGACIVIGSVLGDARLRTWFGAAWLLWLGRRSYSLYLTHLLAVMTIIVAGHSTVPL